MSFSKSWNCTSRFGECNFASWKTHKCKLNPNWKRKTVWLLINNINMKKFAWRMFWTLRTLFSVVYARLTPGDFNDHAIRKKLRHNCTIQDVRLIWKQKIWLAISELLCSLTNENACFIAFFYIQLPLFCTVLRKSCTVLSQSESSNFFMYIINPITCTLKNKRDANDLTTAHQCLVTKHGCKMLC